MAWAVPQASSTCAGVSPRWTPARLWPLIRRPRTGRVTLDCATATLADARSASNVVVTNRRIFMSRRGGRASENTPLAAPHHQAERGDGDRRVDPGPGER